MKKWYKLFCSIALCILISGCNTDTNTSSESGQIRTEITGQVESTVSVNAGGEADAIISIEEIPPYAGDAYVEVNGNEPFFTESELTTESYEYYSELDSLGRCGVCISSVGTDIMPTEERGEIGNVKPTGWHTVKYAGIVDGNYLYNRCHLIAYQLAGENANVSNLITGTRYMNMNGMLPFENMVADYVRESGNHVMYRVSPVFEGNNLVADGVLIEAKSVEDSGAGISFNVFCYNVQPGIVIDYATGESVADGTAGESMVPPSDQESQIPIQENKSYAVNSNNGKIHITGACPATGNGNNAMKHPVYFYTYEEAEMYSVSIAPEQKKRKCGNCW